MKKNSTKKALIMSVLSLLLCVSMLIGSTYAWFTDSVTSGSNVIKSGNLDIDVQYTLDGENWADLAGATDLFKKGLWEPGHTEVVALKIENKGSLALKYVANMNIINEVVGKTKDNKDIVLSDILTVSSMNMDGGPIGDALAGTIFEGEDAVIWNSTDITTSTFKAGNILGENQLLVSGASKYVLIKVDMTETVGNEANHNGTDIPSIEFGINVLATQETVEFDSFDNQYDKDAVYPVANIQEFQKALDEAEDGDVIAFTNDFDGDVTLPQKANTKITIDGNNQTFSGTLLVDGKSATYTSAGVTIKNINFDSATADACITLGKDGDNNTRYTCNVTIENCTFSAPDKVGIKSYTGGDKNLVIRNCTATAEAHSLAQLKGVDGVLIENCTVNSIRGINFNNSLNVTVDNCTIDVQKYAVRFGESANTVVEDYAVTNCKLTSQNGDGDAAIVLRAGALNANLNLTNTTINAGVQMSGHENATITK